MTYRSAIRKREGTCRFLPVDLRALRIRIRGTVRSDLPWGVLVSEGHYSTAEGEVPAGLNPQGAVFAKPGDGWGLGIKPGEFDFVCDFAPDGKTTLVNGTWEITQATPPVHAWLLHNGPGQWIWSIMEVRP